MRTTIRIDDDVLRGAKKLALETDRTLTAVIEDALREVLVRRSERAKRRPVRLPTFGGEGLQPGVDLDDSAALPRPDGRHGMILVDVNVLVYAFRRDSAGHGDYRKWWTSVVGGDEAFGVSDVGFEWVSSHRHAPQNIPPTDPDRAGVGFWGADPFPTALCESESGPTSLGDLSAPMPLDWCKGQPGFRMPTWPRWPIESGCEWITTDRDYARFPGLRWRHPLQ